MLFSLCAKANEGVSPWLIDRGEISFLKLDDTGTVALPDDQALALPLHWDIKHPGVDGMVRIRIRFDRSAEDASAGWSVLVPRLGNAWRIALNDQLLAEAGKLDTPRDAWAAKRPVWLTLPAGLLTVRNTLDITLRLDAGRRAGLSRLYVGPTEALRTQWLNEEWMRIVLPQAASVLSLLVAAFCGLLWWQQHDSLYAWAAAGELAWGIRLMDTWWEASPLGWPLWSVVVLSLIWLWSVALYRMIVSVWRDTRPRWESRAVYGQVLAGPLCLALAWALHMPIWIAGWMVLSLLVWSALCIRLLWDSLHTPNTARLLLTVAATLCVLAMARDVYAGRASPLHYEESAWVKYAAVSLAASVLLIVSLRFQQARKDLVQLNANIQHRLDEREAELRQQHEQVTQLVRDRAASEERTRILRDMHDGAGAHLISAIRQLEGPTPDRTQVLHTLKDSLDQLRLSIDAMHTPPGDINALLSSLRYRLERRIQAAGLALRWEVEELPLLPRLDTTGMRHLQFILLEAISNAIQHAGASRLTVGADTTSEGHSVLIEVRDDGKGMGATLHTGGNGLRGMQERASHIGAVLSLRPMEPGTSVSLTLSIQPA